MGIVLIQWIPVSQRDTDRTTAQRSRHPPYKRIYLIDSFLAPGCTRYILVLAVLDHQSFRKVGLLEISVTDHFGIQTTVSDHSDFFIMPTIQYT